MQPKKLTQFSENVIMNNSCLFLNNSIAQKSTEILQLVFTINYLRNANRKLKKNLKNSIV